jgi:hypothetical protein
MGFKIDKSDPLSINMIKELLKVNPKNGYIFHRESKNIEYKESFNHAGWDEYLKNFAAFANNDGGYIVFGVKDRPKLPVGLNERSAQMFDDIDEEFISGEINKLFSPAIEWEKQLVEAHNTYFGIIYVHKNKIRPVIAKQDEGAIKNGEIYYRYSGRVQKIEYGELNEIIENRIKENTEQIKSLLLKISEIGPSNAAVLDAERGIIEKDKDNILVIDEELVPKIKFIKEGEFSEKKGAQTLKLIGSVHPVDQVEIIKIKKQNLIEQYPYSFTEMKQKVLSQIPNAKLSQIHKVISENNVKNNPKYSAYNFRTKAHEEQYKETGQIPSSTPSLYNDDAINFIVRRLKEQTELEQP